MQRDLSEWLESTISGSKVLSDSAQWLRNLSTRLFLDSPFRPIKTFLNGTWLEHPLHPALTDVPVGAWTVAMFLDAADLALDEPALGLASGLTTGFGALGASATIVTGLMDWTDTESSEMAVGFTHGITNTIATLLFTTSFFMRWRDKWRTNNTHFALSTLGYLTLTLGAYLGGSLVFRQGLMVDRNAYRQGPKDFTPALALADLPENQPKRVEVKNQPILLLRQGDQIYAIGAVCSHLGGPLDKGKLDTQNCTVECPWHYSIYSLEDGSYKQGPTTAPVPAYDVRINNGQIEVKLRK